MSYDVAAVRALFPSLADGVARFDSPGGSQVPRAVAMAVADVMLNPTSQRGHVTAAERATDAIVVGARQAMGDLLGTDPRGVVFGRSMTALTYDLARTLAQGWGPGDEVVVTKLDHAGDVSPWVQTAERAGATVVWLGFDPVTGELDDVKTVLSPRTRLVAVIGASNVIGTRPDVAAIGRAVHDVGALFFVDGVHLTPHAAVDLAEIGCDVYVCSPYKFFGPHLGVLAADPAFLETLHPDKLAPSTDAVPERFEQGTLPYELLAGVTAAVETIAGLVPGDGSRRGRITRSMAAVEAHERSLSDALRAGLAAIPGVTVIGAAAGQTSHASAAVRTPTVYFTVAGLTPSQVHEALAGVGCVVPGGNFYALEASRHLGLGDTGASRAGLAAYSTSDEVDRLVDAVQALVGAKRPAPEPARPTLPTWEPPRPRNRGPLVALGLVGFLLLVRRLRA